MFRCAILGCLVRFVRHVHRHARGLDYEPLHAELAVQQMYERSHSKNHK